MSNVISRVAQAIEKTQQTIDKLSEIELTATIESSGMMIQLREVYNSMILHKATLQIIHDSLVEGE